MNMKEFIEKFEELDRIMIEEGILDMTHYTEFEVHISIESIIDTMRENRYSENNDYDDYY